MKDAYYFSHDSNARHDPKILAMRSIYGCEGYGWFWIIIEMLREQENYKLKHDKYICNALAMQTQCNADAMQKYLEDCINEFELFETDGECFWSNSLIKRMEIKNQKSEKARMAALARWNKNKCTSNADALQTQCDRNAIKGKESKGNKNSINYTSEFENFYSIYPNKFNKEQTFKNWKSLLSKKVSAKEIMTATRNYIQYIKDNNIEDRYITRSTNFLGKKQDYRGYLDYEPKPVFERIGVPPSESILGKRAPEWDPNEFM